MDDLQTRPREATDPPVVERYGLHACVYIQVDDAEKIQALGTERGVDLSDLQPVALTVGAACTSRGARVAELGSKPRVRVDWWRRGAT